MSDLWIQYIRPELLVPALFSWLMERAKNTNWISIITPESRNAVQRLVSALLATLGAVGITMSYDAGTLTITGLTMENGFSLAVLIVQNFLIQHTVYHGLVKQ
jgi:hypothetical protein